MKKRMRIVIFASCFAVIMGCESAEKMAEETYKRKLEETGDQIVKVAEEKAAAAKNELLKQVDEKSQHWQELTDFVRKAEEGIRNFEKEIEAARIANKSDVYIAEIENKLSKAKIDLLEAKNSLLELDPSKFIQPEVK